MPLREARELFCHMHENAPPLAEITEFGRCVEKSGYAEKRKVAFSQHCKFGVKIKGGNRMMFFGRSKKIGLVSILSLTLIYFPAQGFAAQNDTRFSVDEQSVSQRRLPEKKIQGRNLTVVDLAWRKTPVESAISGDIFTGWVLTLRNPNRALFAEFPVVEITAKDADGRIIYSEEEVFFGIPPLQTIAVSGMLDSNRVPAQVTARFVSTSFVRSKSKSSAYKPFKAVGTFFEQTPRGDVTMGGEIINPFSKQVGEVNVTGVLRDSGGNIVGGGDVIVSSLNPNQPKPFFIDETFSWSNGPAASLEIFVQPRSSQKNPYLSLANGR